MGTGAFVRERGWRVRVRSFDWRGDPLLISTGRQGGLNDRTTGSGAYGNQDSSYGSDNLNSGSGLGRDQYNQSSDYGSSGRSDDIADRGTLGRDEYSGGAGLGRDEYSSTSGRDTYGFNTGSTGERLKEGARDTFSSGDNYGSNTTGSSNYGSSRGDNYESAGLTGSSGLHHHTTAGDRIGDDDLKPSHGLERDTHHSTGGNYASQDTEYGSGTTGGAGFGNKSTSGRDTFDDSSNTRFGSSTGTDAYSGSNEYGSGVTGGAGYGNKSSGRDEFNDSSDTRFGSSTETGAYSGSNEYGSGSTSGAGYGNKSAAHSAHDNNEKSDKHGGDSKIGKVMEGLGKMTKNEKLMEKGAAKRGEAGFEDSSTY
ncbi:hypothetical protein D6C84_10438 [Aureobasidium pullulans]|uniref:Uncharacterized protein n=1 Tax=Aureobasidium pullulans TaxID=5580 RepID=A0A4S9WWF4_AURPU|nr:hypothetical protein D6C84_10438 [Aureobasidium pullulans]